MGESVNQTEQTAGHSTQQSDVLRKTIEHTIAIHKAGFEIMVTPYPGKLKSSDQGRSEFYEKVVVTIERGHENYALSYQADPQDESFNASMRNEVLRVLAKSAQSPAKG